MEKTEAKRIVFTGPNVAELLPYDIRPLREDDVLVRTQFSAISNGTERANLIDLPNTAANFPKYLGYSSVGIVEEVGEKVTDIDVGDRVLVYHGFHATYNIVPEHQITKVADENISSPDAAFVIIASMGLGGVRKLELELGESAMVVGLGLLGLFAIQFCRLSGGNPVIAVDLDESRRNLALKLGADYAFDPAEDGFVEKVKSVTEGKGVNATVEVTGASAAMKQALSCAAWQGRIALLGCTRISDCPIDYYQMVHRPGVKLIGAHNFVKPEFESYPHHWTHHDDCKAILKMIANDRMTVAPIISETALPEDAPKIFTRLADGKLPVGVLFDWTKAK